MPPLTEALAQIITAENKIEREQVKNSCRPPVSFTQSLWFAPKLLMELAANMARVLKLNDATIK